MNLQSVLSLALFKTRIAATICLILGFICAIGLRVSVGAPDVARSPVAGLLFAACLAMLTFAGGTKVKCSKRILLSGLVGGLFLCIPAVILRISSGATHTPSGNYLYWSAIVTIVAFAEEAFLRGALYDKISSFSNQTAAIIITALLFAALHIPLYGLRSISLDFAVGLWLGALRYQFGSFVASGVAHAFADLTAWWII